MICYTVFSVSCNRLSSSDEDEDAAAQPPPFPASAKAPGHVLAAPLISPPRGSLWFPGPATQNITAAGGSKSQAADLFQVL